MHRLRQDRLLLELRRVEGSGAVRTAYRRSTSSSMAAGCWPSRAATRRRRSPTLGAALRGNLDGTDLYANRTELHELLGEAYLAQGRPDSASVHFGWVARALSRADPQARPRLERAHRFARAAGG